MSSRALFNSVALAAGTASPIVTDGRAFGALDAQTRLDDQDCLRACGTSRPPDFVTHDIDEALFLADRIFIMTARPGRIKESLAVDFVRPRNYETIIFEQQYITLKQRILQVIRGETLQAMKLEVEVE